MTVPVLGAPATPDLYATTRFDGVAIVPMVSPAPGERLSTPVAPVPIPYPMSSSDVTVSIEPLCRFKGPLPI